MTANLYWIERVVFIFLIILLGFLIITFFKWGPIISSDTLAYLYSANVFKNGLFPHSESYSPAYPFLIAIVSNIFDASLVDVSFMVALFSYALAFVLLYKIIRLLFVEVLNKTEVFCMTALLINSWWAIKILLNAHADSLLFIFHLLIVYFLILSLKRTSAPFYIVSCLLAALAIWAKYNSLVYVPFLLLVPLLFYGWSKKALLGFIPVILSGFSFYLFKRINGTVINHLETTGRTYQFWQGEISKETLLTNLQDSGRVILGSVFSDLIAIKIPTIISILVVLIFFIGTVYFLLRKFGKVDLNAVLLLFSILYIIGLGTMSQLSNHTEMDLRTLFPATLTLLLAMTRIILDKKIKLGYIVLILFLIIQPVRTFAGLVDWYKRAPMDSFKNMNDFNQKKSLIKLHQLMEKLSLKPENIYTNNYRYLVMHLDFQWVKRVPIETEFARGRIRPVNDAVVQKRIADMEQEVLQRQSIIILFNSNQEELNKYKQDRMRLEISENDYILY